MVFKNKIINRLWRFSTSFELGIPILVAIACLIAAGTIVESKLDAYAAKRLIYESWMMYLTMGLLIYNLMAVVIDRLPWQTRHYPFVTVHFGIVILVIGGFVTQKLGVDGSMTVPINGKSQFVSLSETDLVAYATFDGDKYARVFNEEVDFFKEPPTAQKPFTLKLSSSEIKIVDYVPYGRLSKKVKAVSNEQAGSSIRFQLMNANVKQVESITQTRKGKLATFNLGPAKVHLGPASHEDITKNEIYLTPKTADTLTYTIFHRDQQNPFKTGTIKIGDVVATGWMGLELRLLDYVPKATEEWDVIRSDAPTPITTAAVKVERGADTHWLVLNDVLKVFAENEAYLISYQNRRMDLGFPLQLKKFKISRYQGTMKAMEYESEVEAGPLDLPVSAVISMNEPLNYKKFKFYQASFQEDEVTREPVASVFSVNYDPGRGLKYFGSLMVSIGTVWLFYQRRKRKAIL